MAAEEAARLLLGACASPSLSLQVLEVLVREDGRFCWQGEGAGLLTLRDWQGLDPDLRDVSFVALDLETTGAKPGAGKITEVGAVRIEGLSVVGEFHTLVNPQRSIPPMITWITGITDSMVADAPRIEEVVPSLLEFLSGAVVVAHNAPFDVGFLNYELHRLRSRRLGEGAVDTLPLSRALVPGLVNYRLKTVAEALQAPVSPCHRALADAQAVAHVFVHLAEVLQERGVMGLAGVRAHGRSLSPSYLEKLALTRDLPAGPGTFVFLDEDGQALLVGRADRLAEEVRARFMAGARRHRGLRTAVRLVERIDHEPAATPLEAVVREQQLVLQHRPPYNQYWSAPETYLFIAAGGRGPGLTLSATRRGPVASDAADKARASAQPHLTIGPFRRRSAVHEAVSLLRACYPIRSCPRSPRVRPCERGATGRCLAPCTSTEEVRAAHDALATDLMMWLAGCDTSRALDPPARAEALAGELARDGQHEQADRLLRGREQLEAVQRWHTALAKARRLRFACLWPETVPQAAPLARMNLVWGGRLVFCASLKPDDIEAPISEAVRTLEAAATAELLTEQRDCLVAVPQEELDSLLAVGRWYQDSRPNGGRIVPLNCACADWPARVCDELTAAVRDLMAR